MALYKIRLDFGLAEDEGATLICSALSGFCLPPLPEPPDDLEFFQSSNPKSMRSGLFLPDVGLELEPVKA